MIDKTDVMEGKFGRRLLTLVIASVLLLSAVMAAVGAKATDGEEDKISEPKVDYTVHNPIRIDNNGDLAAEASSGNGTESHPYIIEGYDIDGGGYGYCIYIGNTTDHFVVKNCYVHDASGNFGDYWRNTGLYLYNVTNGALENNNASQNYAGILLRDSSQYNTLVNNTAWNNEAGIGVVESSNNTLTNNTANDNTNEGGIIISGSSNNTLTDNTANDNTGIGINLAQSSDYNTLTDNTANDNSDSGIVLQSSSNNELIGNRVINNTDTSGGTFYISQLSSSGEWTEIYDQSFDPQYSTKEFSINQNEDNKIKLRITQDGPPFANVEQIKLTAGGQELTPGYAVYTENQQSVLEDIREIDNNVTIAHDKEIEILWDIPESCDEPATLYLTANEHGKAYPLSSPNDGYFTYDYENSRPIQVDGYLNETDGALSADYKPFWQPTTGHPDGNTYVYLDDDSEYFYVSMDITVDNTDDYGKDWAEITMISDDGEKKSYRIDDFNDTYGKFGFGMTSKVDYKHQTCEFMIPKDEIDTENPKFKIRYYGTAGISYNGGIVLHESEDNTLIANVAFQNLQGIRFVLSHNNTLYHNSVLSNEDHGMYFTYSDYNTIDNNTVEKNLWAGIYLDNSSYNSVMNNMATNNTYGIYLDHSENNTVENNIVRSNWALYGSGVGIYLTSSRNNVLRNNPLENNDYGIYLNDSDSNNIYQNWFIDNVDQAYDDGNNDWDAGDPDTGGQGGNYWSDYTGNDRGDGVGDTPYDIAGDGNQDRYPWMNTNMLLHYNLTININGDGSTDPAEGEYTYDEGTVVTVEATATEGWEFVEWTGDTTGTASTMDITMDADKSITANFEELDEYNLTINIDGAGSTTPSEGSHTYYDGEEVTIEANPDENWVLDEWTGDVHDDESGEVINITMDENKSITAVFVEETVFFKVEIIDSNDEVEKGEEVTVEYRVNNTGNVEGTKDIIFNVDGEQEGVDPDVTIGAGESHTGQFTWSSDEADEYNLEVATEDDEDTATVNVVGDGDDDGGWIPGFTSILLLLAVIVAVAVYHKKH